MALVPQRRQLPAGVGAPMQQNLPQTGVIGSEQALAGGLLASESALRRGQREALELLDTEFRAGRGDLQSALQTGLGALGFQPGGTGVLTQGRTAIADPTFQGPRAAPDVGGLDVSAAQEAQRLGLENINRGISQGVGAINQAIGQGVAALDPFATGSLPAQQRQLALTGALGADAQAQALQGFTESPGQAFLQERGEQALLRNQAAIGGLGGGRVRQELQRQGIGAVQQDLQRQFENLGFISGQGLQAAGQQAGLRGQQAGLTSGLRGQQAGLSSQLLGQIGLAQLGEGAALQRARLSEAGATQRAQLGERGASGRAAAQLAQNIGAGLAGIQQQGSLAAADVATGTGQQIGAGRLGTGQLVGQGRLAAGRDLANVLQGTGAGLANLQQQLGAGVSGQIQTAGSNIANLLQGATQLDTQQANQIATLLANIATQQGSQVAGLPSIPGIQETKGVLKNLQSGASSIGNLLKLSDERLKTNIEKIGETSNGINLYAWEWNEAGKRMAGDQIPVGVIAQELQKIKPEAVIMGEDGYLRVDYTQVA